MFVHINMPLICTKNNALKKHHKDITIPRCRKYKASIPNMIPVIFSLSNNISAQGVYQMVYVIGTNFLPYDTTVNFGNIKNENN